MPSSVRATWRMTFDTPWPTSAAAQCTSARAVLEQPDAGRAEVVEALRVAEVLEADREADAASDAFAAGRVAGAAGQPDRVARQLLRLGLREGRCAPDHLRHGQRAGDRLARRQRVARPERVPQPQLDGIDVERAASLSICASAAKHVCTAPKPRIAPHGGLFV